MNQLQQEYQALTILHTIAKQLNSAVELKTALKQSLKEIVELLEMRTAWIWLLHPASNSVFLAASHNLPPAFTEHPERLSGWCYCIDKYLANQLDSAANISEITCSRLKDLKEGTNDLRFHATVPLFDETQKIGLLNIVSEASGQLTERQLALLYTIGELLSVAIRRTRIFEKSKELGILEERKRLAQKFQNNILSNIEPLLKEIKDYQKNLNTGLTENQLDTLQKMVENIQVLSNQNLNELEAIPTFKPTPQPLQYPLSPLTKRELEVLELLKEGQTNKMIAENLFISERTIKFHVSTLLSKLDAKNRTDAVQIALKKKIVEL